MRRIFAILVFLSLLCGCTSANSDMDSALQMRQKLLNSDGCSFDCVITADYADEIYTFSMHCQSNKNGDFRFEVTAPQEISGVTGKIDGSGGALTFDDKVLAFSLLADEQLSPVSAPWILVHTLQSGYLSAAAHTDDGLWIKIDDSYAEDALQLDIWTDKTDLPQSCEIVFRGRRILSVDVRNFAYV